MPAASRVEEWTGKDVTVGEIERQLACLREASQTEDARPDLRTSVMTHMAWVPEEWLAQARATLDGLADRHPSRTILLVPDPDAKRDGLDADVSLRCFRVEGQERHVCSEVIELHLRGDRRAAPASIVAPLHISDLPVFLRWRGKPPFGSAELDQLVEVSDRLVVDSLEWSGRLPLAYRKLAEELERVAVSDIAWTRTLEWRRAVAALWPGIRRAKRVVLRGPKADASLLAAWLGARLRRQLEVRYELAEELERVSVDGEEVPPPRGPQPGSSDLLSAELDRFGRDPIYEEAVRAAAG